MATASCQLSEDQLLCPICLDVFTDPVTIPCGHNFCKDCIDQHLRSTGSSCPFCKEIFNARPELRINIFISDIAALFRQSQHEDSHNSEFQPITAPTPDEVLCDQCTEPKEFAVKSCLVCLASYCESHLEPHLYMTGLRRHQLIEPQDNLEDRVCQKHDKPVELFCENDNKCVCVLCTYSSCKGHSVVPLKDAFEEHQEQLVQVRTQVQGMITARKQKIQSLLRRLDYDNNQAEKQLAKGVEIFTDLKSSVESALDELIINITVKRTEAEEQTLEHIKELEQELDLLKKKGCAVKQVLRTDDHLHLLQNFQELSVETLVKQWAAVHVITTYSGVVEKVLAKLELELTNKTQKVLKKAEPKRKIVRK